jgi:hypothetical protein
MGAGEKDLPPARLPPDLEQKKATATVLEQAKLLAGELVG